MRGRLEAIMNSLALTADDLGTFLTFADPDAGDRCVRYLPQLRWRYFVAALDASYPQFSLGYILARFTRPDVAGRILSDGSRCGDLVAPNVLTHEAWLSTLTLGARAYDRELASRTIATDASRLRGALALHLDLFGSPSICAECARARERGIDAVQPYEVDDVVRLEQSLADGDAARELTSASA